MKITKEHQDKGQELMQTLANKAWESATFKEQLISNPASAIESVTGEKITLPNNTKLVVEDQTNTDIIYLNIPRKVDLSNIELSDEQLEQVAGGDFIIVPGAVIAGIATVSLGLAAWAYFSK